jgi:hypothetical protein
MEFSPVGYPFGRRPDNRKGASVFHEPCGLAHNIRAT